MINETNQEHSSTFQNLIRQSQQPENKRALYKLLIDKINHTILKRYHFLAQSTEDGASLKRIPASEVHSKYGRPKTFFIKEGSTQGKRPVMEIDDCLGVLLSTGTEAELINKLLDWTIIIRYSDLNTHAFHCIEFHMREIEEDVQLAVGGLECSLNVFNDCEDVDVKYVSVQSMASSILHFQKEYGMTADLNSLKEHAESKGAAIAGAAHFLSNPKVDERRLVSEYLLPPNITNYEFLNDRVHSLLAMDDVTQDMLQFKDGVVAVPNTLAWNACKSKFFPPTLSIEKFLTCYNLFDTYKRLRKLQVDDFDSPRKLLALLSDYNSLPLCPSLREGGAWKKYIDWVKSSEQENQIGLYYSRLYDYFNNTGGNYSETFLNLLKDDYVGNFDDFLLLLLFTDNEEFIRQWDPSSKWKMSYKNYIKTLRSMMKLEFASSFDDAEIIRDFYQRSAEKKNVSIQIALQLENGHQVPNSASAFFIDDVV